jgi:hypothetical protein
VHNLLNPQQHDIPQHTKGFIEFQRVNCLLFYTRTFAFLNFLHYFVTLKYIAYAGRLHFDFCGHCGRDTGYFSDSLAHIPQEKLTPRPRRDPGLFLFYQYTNTIILRLQPFRTRESEYPPIDALICY